MLRPMVMRAELFEREMIMESYSEVSISHVVVGYRTLIQEELDTRALSVEIIITIDQE